jgi:RES domain-containing protein
VAPPIRPHPAFKHLFSNLKKNQSVLSTQWNAPVYRCVEIEWARPEYLITGEGTRQSGSRWMQPNYCRVVHAASTETIALKESRRVYDYYGIQKPKNNPRVSVELIAKLHRLVDLTQLRTIMDSSTIEELLNEDWVKLNDSRVETTAQALGRAILELNVEGLIVPSSRDRRGRNLIWFPEQLRPESQIEIVSQEKLKQWLAQVHALVHF